MNVKICQTKLNFNIKITNTNILCHVWKKWIFEVFDCVVKTVDGDADAEDDEVPGGDADDDDVPGGDAGDDEAPGGDAGNDEVPGGDADDDEVPGVVFTLESSKAVQQN
uniref:Uncharacterized protein n=1 Tax=Panagrolaimus superbus TaxID=310955 RepID=A0A914YNA6_9BILA